MSAETFARWASEVGLGSELVQTDRLQVHALTAGAAGGAPVIVIHGNTSSSLTFVDFLAGLPDDLRAFAVDLRGFGATEPRPIDATRGVRDFADDIRSLVVALGLAAGGGRVHILGWSMGGAVAMQYAIDHPDGVASLVLEAPISPYGFLGSRDPNGTPCWADWAGSGAGIVDPEFVRRIQAEDRSVADGHSPRRVLTEIVVGARSGLDESGLSRNLEAILSTRVGDGYFPGDNIASPNWPGFAPGTRGVMNAMSGRYLNLSSLAVIRPKPPILWVRGADDEVIADGSTFDFGVRGRAGDVPGWPGDKFPPQPMIGQLRRVFDAYVADGGSVIEHVINKCGHSPHLEWPAGFNRLVADFVLGAPR